MATQISEAIGGGRTNRMVVLVSDIEKRRIEDGARQAGLSLSEFVRTATQNYHEPSLAERTVMTELLADIEAGNARIDVRIAQIDALEAEADAFDEDAYKAKLVAAWTKDGKPDWATIRAAFAKAGIGN